MKILFLTISRIDCISQRNIYTDLIEKFAQEGHDVYVITPLERRYNKTPAISQNGRLTILQVKTLNFQKTSFIEKGIANFLVEYQYLRALKKHFPNIRFDLVLYSTPPITFTRIVSFIKRKFGTTSYLLLKDIFPQNAVDLRIINSGGIFHRYFRGQEKAMYSISDIIGCMSPANIEYVIKNNPELDPAKVELNPNSIRIIDHEQTIEKRVLVRREFGIPLDSVVYLYGGNLGKPQGIDFLLTVLEEMKDNSNLFFVIIGSGTEYERIEQWFEMSIPSNALLKPYLPKDDYDQLVQSCDVGMIFLDRRFTIPNFPSRLLSYLEYRLPVIAATDDNTDIGIIIEDEQLGRWSIAGELNSFISNLLELAQSDDLRKTMGNNGFNYLKRNHDISISYENIVKHFQKDCS